MIGDEIHFSTRRNDRATQLGSHVFQCLPCNKFKENKQLKSIYFVYFYASVRLILTEKKPILNSGKIPYLLVCINYVRTLRSSFSLKLYEFQRFGKCQPVESVLGLALCYCLSISTFRRLTPDALFYRHTTDVSQQHTEMV